MRIKVVRRNQFVSSNIRPDPRLNGRRSLIKVTPRCSFRGPTSGTCSEAVVCIGWLGFPSPSGKENTIVEFRRELREGRRKKSEAHIERGRKANSSGKEQSRQDTCARAREAPATNQEPNKPASPMR